eukprot:gnl/Chilomastix_cuspidata/686.p1 GENE.gnl/Chilomastix_cuspidata/686~~gnl/Chilomastix_cuspidata/686.p1  ORF type:complete len:160 (-),score=87.22 gnl/Chilomastix_cuspidata/686:342-821(-)
MEPRLTMRQLALLFLDKNFRKTKGVTRQAVHKHLIEEYKLKDDKLCHTLIKKALAKLVEDELVEKPTAQRYHILDAGREEMKKFKKTRRFLAFDAALKGKEYKPRAAKPKPKPKAKAKSKAESKPKRIIKKKELVPRLSRAERAAKRDDLRAKRIAARE